MSGRKEEALMRTASNVGRWWIHIQKPSEDSFRPDSLKWKREDRKKNISESLTGRLSSASILLHAYLQLSFKVILLTWKSPCRLAGESVEVET